MGIASSPPRLERDELKPRDSKRKNLILDSKKEGKKHCAIAADANCSTRYVRKVLQDEHLRSDETDNAQKEPWYRRLLGDKLANLLVRIEAAQTGEEEIHKRNLRYRKGSPHYQGRAGSKHFSALLDG